MGIYYRGLREATLQPQQAPLKGLIPKTTYVCLPSLPIPTPTSLFSSGAVRYLMNVPGKTGQDLLLVSSEDCKLLDGQDLVPRWTLGATQVLRYVQFLLSLSGHSLLRTSACPAGWQDDGVACPGICSLSLEGLLKVLVTGTSPSSWVPA